MNNDFIITDIRHVIFIGKDEYTGKELRFTSDLNSNELILHLSGNITVLFNGKTLKCTENTIRFLPKGKNEEYTAYREEKGDCIDVFSTAAAPYPTKRLP